LPNWRPQPPYVMRYSQQAAFVMPGLDPGIHPNEKSFAKRDGLPGLRHAEEASAPQAGQARQ